MEWFQFMPHGYWKNPQNQRNFLENLSKELGVKNPIDWGKITVKDFYDHGGHSLLRRTSIVEVLRKNYPGNFLRIFTRNCQEIKWELEWFSNLPRYGRGHWLSYENQLNFLDSIAMKYHVSQPNDWKRITSSLIKSKGGQVCHLSMTMSFLCRDC